jgi:hypothetical protein
MRHLKADITSYNLPRRMQCTLEMSYSRDVLIIPIIQTQTFQVQQTVLPRTGYLSSIKKNLSPASKFDVIIKAAKSFMKITSRGDTTTFNDTSTEGDMDERAFLCDDTDSDGE